LDTCHILELSYRKQRMLNPGSNIPVFPRFKDIVIGVERKKK
jgi:hypothetical protein